jgi:carbon-monoxide dehydrogenase medium subunit
VSFNEVDGVCRDVRIAVAGAADRPIRVSVAEEELEGAVPDPSTFARAGQLVGEAVSPTGDAHASADYRRRVAGVLVSRALDAAFGREDDPVKEA